mgnify:CR=1 FL=1
MRKVKSLIASVLALSLVASMAACNNDTTNDSGNDVTTKSDANADTNTNSNEKVEIKFSWWGGDSRHDATQKTVDAFMAKNPNITVNTQFAAWDGWEDTMSTQFYAGTAPDINQINWNWITSFSSDGSKFANLNDYSSIIDLTQFNQAALDQCTLADKLQAIPVSMTGRIFYWNKSTFDAAGVKIPTSMDELYAAADTFHSVLGADYYPLVMGEYDRAIFMVYYLESIYGKAWVENGKLNYTQEEIEVGLQLFNDLEEKGVIPTIATIADDGAASLDKNSKWIDGKYAGIFEWDSSAPKFSSAAEGQEIVVGDYFKDIGSYQGGFSKVSLAFAISETSQHKNECAKLIEFMLNDDEGTTIMASERGIPLSAKGFANCNNQGILNSMTAEANSKVLNWVQFPLDPKFEDSKLKGNPDGMYFIVMSGLSYKDYDVSTAAAKLIEGINKVLEG